MGFLFLLCGGWFRGGSGFPSKTRIPSGIPHLLAPGAMLRRSVNLMGRFLFVFHELILGFGTAFWNGPEVPIQP
jgi:hypothetical protein